MNLICLSKSYLAHRTFPCACRSGDAVWGHLCEQSLLYDRQWSSRSGAQDRRKVSARGGQRSYADLSPERGNGPDAGLEIVSSTSMRLTFGFLGSMWLVAGGRFKRAPGLMGFYRPHTCNEVLSLPQQQN